MSQVRVLIADDSPMAQSVIRTVLESDPDIRVVGTAGNGMEAVSLSSELRPDVITMDINMPHMNGFEAIQKIMASHPTPILVITSSREAGTAFKSLSFGALEVMEKPQLEADFQASNFEDFNRRIKMISRVKVVTHLSGKNRRIELSVQKPRMSRMVAIVSSTGGPRALAAILGLLPSTLAAPVLIVQHMADGFMEGLVSWLQGISPLRVKMAEDNERLTDGTVYVAPSGRHLTVDVRLRLCLSPGNASDGHCPSGNVLLESLAHTAGSRCMGILLTGMGSDGASGLQALRASGGRALVQDEQSCLIYGMPKAAIENGAAEQALPLDGLAGEIIQYAGLSTAAATGL